MKLQKNPNYWSCLPTAFAMATDKPVMWFIQQIGHPGAEEPYDVSGLKAGFHEQECIEVLQKIGLACTPIELGPTISPYPDGHDAKPIFFGLGLEDNWARFLQHLNETRGVITGLYRKPSDPEKIIGHAVAWCGKEQSVYDSNFGGRVYPLTEAYKYGFIPRCFWKLQRVNNGKLHG